MVLERGMKGARIVVLESLEFVVSLGSRSIKTHAGLEWVAAVVAAKSTAS